MVSATKTGPQDMPPPGGYGPIQTERVRIKTVFTGESHSIFIFKTIKIANSVCSLNNQT